MCNKNEKVFFQWVGNVLKKHKDEVARINESAEMALFIKKYFKPMLLKYINSNIGAKELRFPMSRNKEEYLNYDLKQEMDEELVNQVASLGYAYCME